MSRVEPDSPEDTLGWLATGNAKVAGELAGQTLGDFLVERLLGRGGMGEVYLAKQISLNRQVALKVLRTDLVARPSYLSRFETEAAAVAKLNHPNIVHVYAYGKLDPIRFIAMEYVEGTNLREYIGKKGALELPLAYSIMRQSAQAIQAAGEIGLVHRDIKPENILVTRRGKVKVADFGLCRDEASEGVGVTQTGVTMGTPLYMSPEQAQGHSIDHRSDLYSLGVTFYHMLSGNPPFRGDSAISLALKHVREFPRSLLIQRPDLPIETDRLVMKLMAKSPDDRYQSAAEMLSDLSKCRDAMQGHATSGATGAILDMGHALALREELPRQRSAADPWAALPSGADWGTAEIGAGLVGVPQASAPVLVMEREATELGSATGPRFRVLAAILIGVVCLGGGAFAGWKGRAPDVTTLPAPVGAMPMLWAVPQWSSVVKQKGPEEQFRYAAFLSPREEWVAAWAAVPGYFRGSHELVSRAYAQLARIWFRLDNRRMLEGLAKELGAWKEKQTRDDELVTVIELALKLRNGDNEGAAERAERMSQLDIRKMFDPTLLQFCLEVNQDALTTMTKSGVVNPTQPFVRAQRRLYRQLFMIEGRNSAGPGRAG